MNYNRIPSLLLMGLIVLLLAGCAITPRWPAISDEATGERIPGRWVWIDLVTPDVKTSRDFYGSVLGWRFVDAAGIGNDYLVATANDEPVAGLVRLEDGSGQARSAKWLGLMSVADITRAVQQVEAGGGKVRLTARELPGRGNVAVLADPEGATFGLIRTIDGDPPDRFPATGSLLWMELWAGDGARMTDFYQAVGGYRVSNEAGDGGIAEWHLHASGAPRAGIIEIERKDVPSTWLPYVRVADLGATLQRVEQAGGSVRLAPSPDIRQGRIAIIIDPQGAALGVAEWPEPADGGDK